jgi:hypothetical protein
LVLFQGKVKIMKIKIVHGRFLPSKRLKGIDLLISIIPGRDVLVYPMNDKTEVYVMNSSSFKRFLPWEKGTYDFRLGLFIFVCRPIKGTPLITLLKKNIPESEIIYSTPLKP